MNNFLSGITRLPGVLASAIFDKNEQCLESKMDPPYEEILLLQVIQQLEGSFDVYESSTDDSTQEVKYFVAHFENGKLIMRLHEGYFVTIVTDNKVNQASVGVALNVVMVKLARFVSKKRTQIQQSTFTQQSFQPATVQAQIPAQIQTAVGKTVGTHKVKALLALFQLSVGPAAKTVLKRTMISMGYRPRTLTQEQYPKLVAALGRRIHNKSWQEKFIYDASRLA